MTEPSLWTQLLALLQAAPTLAPYAARLASAAPRIIQALRHADLDPLTDAGKRLLNDLLDQDDLLVETLERLSHAADHIAQDPAARAALVALRERALDAADGLILRAVTHAFDTQAAPQTARFAAAVEATLDALLARALQAALRTPQRDESTSNTTASPT